MSRNSTKSTDTSTDAPEAVEVSVFAELVEAYKAAPDAKARAAVRKQCETGRDDALRALDLPTAQRYLATLDALRVDAPAKAEAVPAHVTVAQRVYALREAANLILGGEAVPGGVEFDFDAMVEHLDSMTLTDDLREQAVKLASAKITRSVDRHDIAEYIVRAFDGQEPGTVWPISKVRQEGKVEGYTASPGAIRANMEGESAPEGFELIERSADGSTPYSIRYVG